MPDYTSHIMTCTAERVCVRKGNEEEEEIFTLRDGVERGRALGMGGGGGVQ